MKTKDWIPENTWQDICWCNHYRYSHMDAGGEGGCVANNCTCKCKKFKLKLRDDVRA